MGQRIAFAVFVGAILAATGAVAACPAPPAQPKDHHAKVQKPSNDCVDFNTLPQISEHIVAAEPAAAPIKATPLAPLGPDNPVYNGPTLGLSKPEPGVRPAPTVGYKWSLD
jgi:hypothetical protein